MLSFLAKGGHDMSGGEAATKGGIKLGGELFTPGDPASIAKFNAWKAKLAGDTNATISLPDGHSVPANSIAGKAEIMKADLQINHGIKPQIADKAVQDFVAKTKTSDTPVKAVPKAKQMAPAGKAKINTAPQKGKSEGRNFRGPNGPIY